MEDTTPKKSPRKTRATPKSNAKRAGVSQEDGTDLTLNATNSQQQQGTAASPLPHSKILASPLASITLSPKSPITYSRRDRRRAAAPSDAAGAKRTHKELSTSDSESDDVVITSFRLAKTKSSKSGGKAKPNTGTTPNKTNTTAMKTAIKPKPRPVPRKKTATTVKTKPMEEEDATLSDLTSLSALSDVDAPASRAETPKPQGKGKGRAGPRAKKPTSTPKHQEKRAKSVEKNSVASVNANGWLDTGLSKHVWVLIEYKSCRVFNIQDEEYDDKERVWWPGKITSPKSTDRPLKIKLFGEGMKSTSIQQPCSKNISSRFDSRAGYRTPSFVICASGSFNEDHPSPRKKRRTDRREVETKWAAALKEMEEEMDSDDEDLPSVADAFLNSSQPMSISAPPRTREQTPARSQPTTQKEGRKKLKTDDDTWVAPGPDLDLDIPGELILARDHASDSAEYWPAKIVDYIPPTKRTQEPKYEVVFLDKTKRKIPRSWFYVMEEDGFSSCRVGKFESSWTEVPDDDDPEEMRRKQDVVDQARRCPSPIPADPPPSAEEFAELPIREQFVYTKGVLKAILNHEYAPVNEKHRKYMAQGAQQKAVVGNAGLRGKVSPSDVDDIQQYLDYWALRDEGVQPESFHKMESEAMSKDGDPVVPAVVTESTPQPTTEGDGMDVDKPIEEPVPSSSLTPPPTTSPAQAPPDSSSTVLVENEPTSSQGNVFSPRSVSQFSDATAPSATATEVISQHDIDEVLSELTASPTIEAAPAIPRPGRQIGCPEYEQLDTLKKHDYCLNILLPEALRQILLFRKGLRRSVGLGSEEEEEILYTKGEALLQETDWVHDIMRYREVGARNRARKGPKSTPAASASGTRRRKSVNYRE